MGCMCDGPGFCPRYNREMQLRPWQLCRTRSDYRELYEKRHGVHAQPTVEDMPSCVDRGEQCAVLTAPVGSQKVYSCANVTICETTAEQCRACSHRRETIERDRKSIDDVVPVVARGPSVAKWAVGVTTAPRKRETFTESMRSILEAGFAPRIFAEPDSPIPDEFRNVPLTQHRETLGCWPNYYMALQELLTRQPDADAYAIFQDDIIVAKGTREYLERALWPTETCGVVSIYCSLAYAQEKPGWYTLDQKWVWGACAFIFPRDQLVHFLSNNAIHWRLSGRAGGVRNIDIVVGNWAKEHSRPVWYCSPSLVQHIGNASTLWDNARATGKRKARDFVEAML